MTTGPRPLDVEMFARSVRRAVVQAWFDEDWGIALSVFGRDGPWGEIDLPVYGNGNLAATSVRLLDRMVREDVIDAAGAAALHRGLAKSNRKAWIHEHALAVVLDLPFATAVPYPAPRRLDVTRPKLKTLAPPPDTDAVCDPGGTRADTPRRTCGES